MHPIYADGKLAVAQNTALEGRVIALEAIPKRAGMPACAATLRPSTPVQVQFDKLELPSGPSPSQLPRRLTAHPS